MRVNSTKGFTLIELVLVIVIIGILAAVAIPTFVNLTEDARRASTQGSLGNARAATSMAYARRAADGLTTFNTLASVGANVCGTLVAEGGTPYDCFQTGLPRNPITGSTAVVALAAGACACAALENAAAGWWYNAANGEWRPSLSAGYCAANPGQTPCTW